MGKARMASMPRFASFAPRCVALRFEFRSRAIFLVASDRE